MTRYPKLLPWMARRFDVPVELAQKLWRRALGDAVELAGRTDGPEVHRFAIDRFIDLLEQESCGDACSTPTPDSEWYWRHQRRMAALSFTATNATCRWWESFWQLRKGRKLIA